MYSFVKPNAIFNYKNTLHKYTRDYMSNEKIRLHYGDNTPNTLRTVLRNTVSDVMNKSQNRDLFKGLSIYLTDDYSNVSSECNSKDFISDKSEYESAACTINPIFTNGNKEIILNTNGTEPSLKNLFGLINDTPKTETEIENNFLHELGHQFDYHYSSVKLDQNLINIANKYLEGQISEEKFEQLTKAYFNSQLSDSKEFKEAWIDDVEKFQSLNNLDKLYEELDYYAPDWFVNYDDDDSNNINWRDGIDNREIELVSKERGEIFAQIFADLLNTQTNTEEENLRSSLYSNCVNCIKDLLQKYLGINF